MSVSDQGDRGRTRRRGGCRRAGYVALVVALLTSSVGFVDAGADDPEVASETTVATSGPPSTAVGGSSTTSPGGGPTTSDPDAPPVTSGPGGFGGPKIDPDAPPEPPMPDPSPEVRALLEQLLSQQRVRLEVHRTAVTRESKIDVDSFERHEARARSALAQSRSALKFTQALIEKAERDLRADALARYMNPGSTGIGRMVDPENRTGRTRTVLIDVSTELHRGQRRDRLAQRSSLNRRIVTQQAALERASRTTKQAKAKARKAQEREAKAIAELEAERRLVEVANRKSDEELAVARAAVLGTPAQDWSLPIAGKSVFTAEELADWFVQRGFPSRAQAPIGVLAKYYIDEGNDQGIRGDMAFAQSVLETGSFTNQDTIHLNNFAGVGHCDTCASGFAFATPQLGVRGQIQLLADYTQRGVPLAHPLVDRRLHGPSGCCQTWWQLTHTWATAGNYGPKIMGIYREMLHWLVLRRGMIPVVGPR